MLVIILAKKKTRRSSILSTTISLGYERNSKTNANTPHFAISTPTHVKNDRYGRSSRPSAPHLNQHRTLMGTGVFFAPHFDSHRRGIPNADAFFFLSGQHNPRRDAPRSLSARNPALLKSAAPPRTVLSPSFVTFSLLNVNPESSHLPLRTFSSPLCVRPFNRPPAFPPPSSRPLVIFACCPKFLAAAPASPARRCGYFGGGISMYI